MLKRIKYKIINELFRVLYRRFLQSDRKLLADCYSILRQSSHDEYKANVLNTYDIDKSVRFSYGTQIYGDGKIKIGKDTYFGENCFIQCQNPAQITIGEHCAIAHNIHIRTSDYKKTKHLSEAMQSEGLIRSIVIGDYVWIGANVYINGGITIGDNSIIGANSVVTKDVPPNSIVGGVPTKLIKFKDDSYTG